MPGVGSYGPGGKWVHDRAKRIMSEGDVPKHIAYAIATQQGHKVDKSSKKHRTTEGVMSAKQKYTAPKSEYQKTAMLAAFFDEMEQIEKVARMGWLGRKVVGPLAIAGGLMGNPHEAAHVLEHSLKAPSSMRNTVTKALQKQKAGIVGGTAAPPVLAQGAV